MTEPSSGTPSPLPAEPAEPGALDPATSVDEAADAELEPEDVGEETEADELETEADELELGDEEEGEEEPEPESWTEEQALPGAFAPPPGARGGRRRGAPAPVVQRAPTQSELAVRVTDNASRIFVLATVAAFAAILGFGLLAGNGGLLTPIPSPTPVPSVSAAPSSSVAPSGSVVPSVAAPSESVAPSASPS